jgi:hypothetical protein
MFADILIFTVLIFLVILFLRNQQCYNLSRIGGSSLRIKNLDKHPRSRSEAQVISYLEELTSKKFPTVYPSWLMWRGSILELDGYNDDLKIGLEFSGPLHIKWYPNKEEYTSYFQRIVRDKVKRNICKKNGVYLIVVDSTLPTIHWRNYVKSRLFDVGVIEDKPVPYITEQVVKPYRNKHLERQLGLMEEMKAVSKINN